MSLNRKRGKRAERRVAKRLGGTRVGTMGGEDVSHPLLSVEVKSRQAFVGTKWYQQAKRNSNGKIPVVVVHIIHQKEDFVIVGLSDFQKMMEGIK